MNLASMSPCLRAGLPALLACIWLAAVAFPFPALADVSETTILPVHMALNLETGALGSSGGDILWDGIAISPQGTAKIRNIGTMGVTSFHLFGLSFFAPQAAAAKTTPIPAAKLIPGDVLVVVTNSGKTAKVLVYDNGGGALTLEFVTYGISPPAGTPLVSQILNNSSYVPRGYPNSGISPSSVFVIFGSGMSDPGNPVPQASAPPGLPLSLSGTSITVVVNGVTTHPAMYYASPGQIAAVLPAATPIGTGLLTITYRGITSAPTPIQVVPSALGINTYSNGEAVATDASTYALLSYTNSGTPGQTIVLWTTGLGANPADSDTIYTTTPHSVKTPLQVYIGGVPATILYQGASGYPGVNQIDLVIPKSAPTGCWVPVAAVAGGVISNTATIAINNGGGDCFDAVNGLKGNQVAPPNGQSLRTGLVALIQTNSPDKNGNRVITNSTDAAFETYTGLYPTHNTVSPGACIVNQTTPSPFPNLKGLESGDINLAGPSGLSVKLKSQGIAGAFYALLSAAAITSAGGTYTFTGAGGKDVGRFTSTLTLNSPLITWTNAAEAATIDRSKGLHVTWSGGNPGSYLFILGSSTSADLKLNAGFTCLVKTDDGEFTVPDYILSGLPAGMGGAQIQNQIYTTLPASGLDASLAIADITYSVPATFK